MKRYLPYLFVLGLLMVSCVRDVEIDLEDLPDRIVLNASVCPGKEVRAHLSKTWLSWIVFPISIYLTQMYVSISMINFKALCAMMIFGEIQ